MAEVKDRVATTSRGSGTTLNSDQQLSQTTRLVWGPTASPLQYVMRSVDWSDDRRDEPSGLASIVRDVLRSGILELLLTEATQLAEELGYHPAAVNVVVRA